MERIIERTDDGSATLFVPALDEHYHSTKGARTESQHIFVEMGLKASGADVPHVLEIGFGTGLNAWLTLEEAERSKRSIRYTGLELYPLEWSMVRELGYIEPGVQTTVNGHRQSALALFERMHAVPWQEEVSITPHFSLRKLQLDVNALTENGESTDGETAGLRAVDVIYFDAFAPEKQPEVWSQELFNRLFVLLNQGGILTTYCAKGAVRRMLQTAGFRVERLAGPPGGKREILRANK